MEIFCECLGQAIRQGFSENHMIVIVIFSIFFHQLLEPVTGGDSKRSDMIRAFVGNEIGEREIRLPLRLLDLLSQEMKSSTHCGARLVGEENHIIPDSIRGKEPIDRTGGEQFLGDDGGQKLLRGRKQLGRLLAVFLMLQDRWIASAKLPGMEKRGPIDVRNQFVEGDAESRCLLLRRCSTGIQFRGG